MKTNNNPNPISHKEAVKDQMADHFVLGTLDPEKQARFEAHFFDCNECFENVRIASEFLQHAHRILSPEPEKGSFAQFIADFRRPATRVMASLFLAVAGFGIHQQMRIAHIQIPAQEYRAYLTEQTRSPGSEKPISVPRNARLALEAGFLQRDEFKSYRSLILSEPDKRIKYIVPLHLEKDDVSATIVFPPEILPEGTYSILIQGQMSDGKWKALEE